MSSTFRDLEEERKEIIDNLDQALEASAMEKFIPKGEKNQVACINNIKDSEIVIFLISPYYGTPLDTCVIEDCRADCSMKNEKKEKISFTHCEYRYTLAEKKLHMAYKVEEEKFLKKMSKKQREKYRKTRKSYEELEREVGNEFSQTIIKGATDVSIVREHLAQNIAEWYKEKDLHFYQFCGRRDKLHALFTHMDETVKVWGVGGVGKTALIHLALLLQKLRGKRIVTVGKKQSYATGSGYEYFKKKCAKDQHEILGDRITLEDIASALSILEEVKGKVKEETLETLSRTISPNTVLFIDDFHLADEDVQTLVKRTRGVVVSSRRETGVARYALHLLGVDERGELIDMIAGRLDVTLSGAAREKVAHLAEGHPVSTEVLVRNAEKINFETLENYKKGLDLSNASDAQEFLERVVKETLSEEGFQLLRKLSVINTEVESNLDWETVGGAYEAGVGVMNELVETGMLQKKEGKEGLYTFTHRHIQDALGEDEECHKMAVEYYMKKRDRLGANLDDDVEKLFHQAKVKCDAGVVGQFLKMSGRVTPVHSSFEKMIETGEILREKLEEGEKAPVLGTLGNLYRNVHRFEEAEKAYSKALEIYQELAKKNPEAYLSDYLQTQANAAFLYLRTSRTEKGIEILETVLKKRNLLPTYGANIFIELARVYEQRKEEKAVSSYFNAAATYFILFLQGIPHLNTVLHCLAKVSELDKEEQGGDATLMLAALHYLSTKENVPIPDVPHTQRGQAIIEAFKGNEPHLDPHDEIDSMALRLASDVQKSLNQ